MSVVPQRLLNLIEELAGEYPELSKKIVHEMALKTYNRMKESFHSESSIRKIIPKEFEPAFLVEQQLGLSSSYFSSAFRKQSEIKALIIKEGKYIYVKLDFEIKKLLADGYICCKITSDEKDYYEHTFALTKNTLLGFYK